MTDTDDDDTAHTVDAIFTAPAETHAEAEAVIANAEASDEQRAQAFTKLGRSAYYDNRMSEAVRLFRQALPLTADRAFRADIALLLAPALSKEGKTTDALAVLDLDETALSEEQRGTLHNQRGIMFVELGRLTDAIEAFELGLSFHRSSGDESRQARTLVNLAAAASERGDLEKAEACYEEAWKLAIATGQTVAGAVIEGNLGYVASRQGDFAAALTWYGRARDSFAELGDVDLLVAVLETDHAMTLLDLGLNNDAYEAAEYARRSSESGTNKMNEVQARLLLGEAQLRLRHFRDAELTLTEVRAAAGELDVRPWVLRSEYLLHQLRVLDGSDSTIDVGDLRALADGLVDAGWYRESLRTLVLGARRALDRGASADVTAILDQAGDIDPTLVDPIDAAYADALRAFATDDEPALERALSRGFAEVARQRQLLGSAEHEARLGHRARDLRALALRGPLSRNDALSVLAARERARWRHRPSSPAVDALRADVRDARVGLQEATMSGRPTADHLSRLRMLTASLLAEEEPHTVSTQAVTADQLCDLPSGARVVRFVEHRGALWSVVADGTVTLHELGDCRVVSGAARAQRTALRRMATNSGDIGRALAAGHRLESLLFDPAFLAGDHPIVIVPDGPVAGISWSGLPALADREVIVSPSATAAIDIADALSVSSVGLLDGGRVPGAPLELRQISDAWGSPAPSMIAGASVASSLDALASNSLVHVAAHGAFRPENPFLSSLEFVDGELTVLDLERAASLPELLILASCDTGAVGNIGDEAIGTTETLLALGVRAVVAPTVVVDDAATQRLMIDLHSALADGRSPAAALRAARLRSLARDHSPDAAVAQAFQVHGGASSLRPIEISRI